VTVLLDLQKCSIINIYIASGA